MYNPATLAMEKHTENATLFGMSHGVSMNRMGWVVQQALEEILGKTGGTTMHDLLNLPISIKNDHSYNGDPNLPLLHISRLQAGLESAYGPRAGRGLAIRVGNASLKYALREFGSELGLTDLAFRLLPLQDKLKIATKAFAALFNTYTDQKVRLEMDERYFFWHTACCRLCWESQAEGPSCHLAVGFLQEALFWTSGGKQFEVVENKDVFRDNDSCTILINRIPMS